jgi:hypothetical protein
MGRTAEQRSIISNGVKIPITKSQIGAHYLRTGVWSFGYYDNVSIRLYYFPATPSIFSLE